MADSEMMANVRGGALVGAGFGGMIGAVIGWIMGASMVAVPVIGPVVGQGVLSTALVAFVAGAAGGGLLGALAGVFSPASVIAVPAEVATTTPLTTPLFPISPVPNAEIEAEYLVHPQAEPVAVPTITEVQPETEGAPSPEADQPETEPKAEPIVAKDGTPVLRVRRRVHRPDGDN